MKDCSKWNERGEAAVERYLAHLPKLHFKTAMCCSTIKKLLHFETKFMGFSLRLAGNNIFLESFWGIWMMVVVYNGSQSMTKLKDD